MNGGMSEGARRPEAPPWEQLGRFVEGHGGYEPASARRAISTQSSSYGRGSSRAMAAVKPGLTRRGVIYEYVRSHPGTHVRGMAKELGIATGDLHYHLFWLERHGFVKTRKTGFYRFVFPTMVFREDQEVLLGVLSQDTPREILLCLLLDSAATQGDLASRLGYSQPTVSWHMDRLVQAGVVSRTRTGAGIFYKVACQRDDVLTFVKSYHHRVWKRWAGRHGDLLMSAGVERADKGRSLHGPMPPAVVELIGKR